ncbi:MULTISPECIES: hypothetical protein [Halorussus]|uniref:hypothetical protein n=1 Tax=Halorussus TaxID=1070314 RepID=UPI00209EDB32|nr:hypothetical protein [Halorussus vallis]USZ76805.1 hypothetical protein NGM07_05625 [Halorussus vallis]
MDFERFLDYVFFAGLEISILSVPALYALLYAEPKGPVALAGLTAIVASTLAAALFRGGWVDLGVGEWPRPGDPYTLPVRSAYYSATVAIAAYVGAFANVETGVPAAGIAAAAVVCAASMTALPPVVGGMRSVGKRLVSVRF